MSTVSPRRRPRRLTQPQRSAATRQALLDATIESLAELGYDRTTTTEISERAGLSRGAQLHHYGTRAALLTAAAAALAERARDDLRRAIDRLPNGTRRIPAALDMLWELFNGPLFQAVLELSVHARTDPELRADLDPAQREIYRDLLPALRAAFGRDPGDRGLDDAIAVAVAAIRGLAIVPLLDPGRDPSLRWKRYRRQLTALFEAAST